MSHFKYEIDERNLRLQLKANEIPFNEDAWQKFENFAATRRGTDNEDVIKRFSLSLNRNVILPIVFGGVIILFSLLLFNFINIKNPNAAREARAEVKKQPAEEPVPNTVKKEPEPVIKQETPVVTPEENTLTANMAAEPVKNTVMEPAVKETITKAETTPKTEANNTLNTNNAGTIHASATPARQQKKRSVVVAEATAAEDEQAPPPVTEPVAHDGELK